MTGSRRIALVTGSSSGIGATVARTLAGAGYDVIINYSRSADAAKKSVEACNAAGSDTLLVQCDVSDEASVIAMVAAINAVNAPMSATTVMAWAETWNTG